LNVALNVVLAPAAIVVDVLKPVWPNPVPLTVTCENDSVALPALRSVTCCEFVVPTAMLPKGTLVGVAEICACTPVPLSESVAGEFGALLVIEMLPEALPAAVGVNVAVNVPLDPAAIDVGAEVIV
jgi:hypothetical protein